MKRKYRIFTLISLLFIAFGCASVEPVDKFAYSYFPVPYLSEQEYQYPFFKDFITDIKPYLSKGVKPDKYEFLRSGSFFKDTLYNTLNDDKNKVPYPLTFDSVIMLDKIMRDKREEKRKQDPYEILEFKDIRYETAEPNKVDYRYGLYEDVDYNFRFYDLFVQFMINHYDIQNEKDFLYYWIKVQTAIIDDNYNDFNIESLEKNRIRPYICEDRGESNKWVMKSLLHIPTYTIADTRPGVLEHLWNTYSADNEWWSSEWGNTFIANFAIYVGNGVANKDKYDLAVQHKNDYIFKDDTPLTAEDYKNRISWLRDDIYEDGARNSFLSKMRVVDFASQEIKQRLIMYARSYGKLGEEYVLRETINKYAYKRVKSINGRYTSFSGLDPSQFYYLSPKEFYKAVEDILRYKRETMSRSEYEQFRDRLIKDTEWFKRDDLRKIHQSFKIYNGTEVSYMPDYYKFCDKIVTDTAEFNKLIEDEKKHK